MNELLPCPLCRKPPGSKVGPPALVRCIAGDCEGRNLAAVTVAEWNARPPSGREALTDDEIEKAILKFARERSRVFPLTYESGPYEITKATGRAMDFARAILSLITKGTESAPVTDGREEVIEQCAKIAESEALTWINGEATTACGQAYQNACRNAAKNIRALSGTPAHE